MVRIIGAIIIFTVSILACISEIFILNSSINDIKQDVEAIELYVNEDDIETAITENKSLEEKFNNKYSFLSTFIDHNRLENIEESILLMSVNLENDCKEDFFVESSKAISGLDHLNNTELPSIGNIF